MSEQQPNMASNGGELRRKVARYTGIAVGTVATAVAAKFGAADFARDLGTGVWEFDYSDNIRDGGLAIVALAGTTYTVASCLTERSRVANTIVDHKRAALMTGAAGLGIWAVATGAAAFIGSRTEDNSASGSKLPIVDVTSGPVDSILATAPEETVITVSVNPEAVGYYLATPSGRPCEVYFPFNDPDHVANNVMLVQAGLRDIASITGDQSLDPGPIDGEQGSQTNAALQYWRGTYLNVPEGQVFDLAQCDGLPTLTDGDMSTPTGIPRL